MPLFEYICVECEAKFEELVRSSEMKVACPKCGSVKTEKQVSRFSSNAIKGGHSCGDCKPKSGFS